MAGKKTGQISDREHANLVWNTLRNYDSLRKQLDLEQIGELLGDDDTVASLGPQGPTYKERRAELAEKDKRVRSEYSHLLPIIEEFESAQ